MPMGKLIRVSRSSKRGLNFKQVKQVQKIINTGKQIKTFRTTHDVTTTNAGFFVDLSAVTEGDDFFQRDGDKIHAVSLKTVASMLGTTALATKATIRVLIVRSKTGPLVVGDMPAALLAQPDLDKMQVLYDHHYQFTASGLGDQIEINYFKSFKNRKVPWMNILYDDDESALLSQSNGVYLFLDTDAAANGPLFRGYSVLKFYDH